MQMIFSSTVPVGYNTPKEKEKMAAPTTEFWAWLIDYFWVPLAAVVGIYMAWLERRFAAKASREKVETLEKIVDTYLKKIDEVIAKHIEQDRENFQLLFAKVDSNKDIINEKSGQIIEKINSNHVALLNILAAKQDRRFTDIPK